jgi:hypothetical protein
MLKSRGKGARSKEMLVSCFSTVVKEYEEIYTEPGASKYTIFSTGGTVAFLSVYIIFAEFEFCG